MTALQIIQDSRENLRYMTLDPAHMAQNLVLERQGIESLLHTRFTAFRSYYLQFIFPASLLLPEAVLKHRLAAKEDWHLSPVRRATSETSWWTYGKQPLKTEKRFDDSENEMSRSIIFFLDLLFSLLQHEATAFALLGTPGHFSRRRFFKITIFRKALHVYKRTQLCL